MSRLFAIPLLLIALGCGSERDEPFEATLRLLATELEAAEPRLFSFDRIGQLETVAIEGAAELLHWSPPAGSRVGRDTAGTVLEIPVEKPPALLVRRSTEDLGRVDVLELELEGAPLPGFVDLDWAGPADVPQEERRIRQPLPRRPMEGTYSVRFDLGAHPAWSGSTERLVLRLGGATGRLRVRNAHWLRRAVSPSRLEEAAAGLHAVEVGHELRPGFLLLPGRPWTRTLDLPPGAELRLGIATTPGTRHSVAVAIAARSDGAEVHERVEIEPSGGHERWLDMAVQLDALAGAQAEITITAAVPEGFDPTREAILVSAPQLSTPTRGKRPPNVLLVSIDTLRADRMSLYGYQRPTTPLLEGWARERAVVFEEAISHASSTLPAHASLFTGLEPLGHGAVNSIPASAGLTTLAEQLRDAGYATLGVTGGGYLHPAYGLAQGFDRYRYWNREQDDGRHEIEDGVERAEALLKAYRDTPFFLFFHTYEVHGPYRVREPWAGLWGWQGNPQTRIWPRAPAAALRGHSPAELAAIDHLGGDSASSARPPAAQVGRDFRLLSSEEAHLPGDLYDMGIARADELVARLLAELERLGLAERTIVVVTSDHGEALGEGGLWSHGYLQEHNLRVPLLVATPGSAGAGRRIPGVVRLVDVAPTILDLAGVPVPEGIDGTSLVPLLGNARRPAQRTAWAYAAETNQGLAVRTGELKYILRDTAFPGDEASEELYALGDDPGETRNLAASHTATAGLRRQALQRLRRAPAGLRLDIVNRGRQRLQGSLESPALGRNMVKIVEPPPVGSLALERPGLLRYSLDRGESIRLRLAAPGDSLPFVLTAASGEVVRGEAEPASLCRGTVLLANPDGLELRARLTGPFCDAPPTMAADEDDDLKAQLRALGYVE